LINNLPEILVERNEETLLAICSLDGISLS